MLIFDGIVLVATAFWAIVAATRHRWPAHTIGFVLTILTVAILTHLAVEGFRWQMVPAYIAVTIALLRRRPASRARAWIASTMTLVLALASLSASIAFPLFTLPLPTGPYAIATTGQHVIDFERDEIYTRAKNDPRELMLKVWYPTDALDGERAPYWRDSLRRRRAVTSITPLPSFTFAHLGLVGTNSFQDASIDADERYPVLIYAHGVGIGWAGGITILAEELASHGFIVVSINHAYVGSMSIFPDGRLVGFDPATATAMNTPPPDELKAMQAELRASRDGDEQVALYGSGMALMPNAILGPITRALDAQGGDLRFVMDQLETWQQSGDGPAWVQAADLDRIGLFGNSLGGSAVFETCRQDLRCRAGVAIDGFHPRQIGVGQAAAPFLYFNAAENLLFTTNLRHSTAAARVVLVEDVTHFNFFDFAVMSPLYRALGVLGPIDGELGLEILGHHVRIFFAAILKERSASPHEYDGVRIENFPARKTETNE